MAYLQYLAGNAAWPVNGYRCQRGGWPGFAGWRLASGGVSLFGAGWRLAKLAGQLNGRIPAGSFSWQLVPASESGSCISENNSYCNNLMAQ